MGRIFAIDYGKKRVGFAVTDPLKIISTPLKTVPEQDAINFIRKYTQEEEVETMVVGLPFKDSGEPTHATPLVQNFIRNLQKNFPNIPIVTEDESYTSKRAVEIMIASGMKKKERREKSNVDKISASLILQSYLDSFHQRVR